MSDTYLTNTLSLQPSFGGAAANVQRHLLSLVAGLRASRAKRRSLATLRTLTQETLDDIGVDARELKSSPPLLVRSNPYVIAFSGLNDCRYFDVGEGR